MSNINDANLKKLRQILKERAIDYFILPNNDEFFSEYLPESEKKIEFLTGFSGSNAAIIIGQKQCWFFTDGRYVLQAKKQLNLKEYKIYNLAEESLFSWLENNLKKNKKLAFYVKNHDIGFVNKISAIINQNKALLLAFEEDFFDKIWLKRPKKPDSKIYFHDLQYSGKDSIKKRQEITANLSEDAILFTSSASIAWLLNIRASDIKYTPLLLAYGILYKNNDFELFCDQKRMDVASRKKLTKVNFNDPKYLPSRIADLKSQISNLQIDLNSTNYWIYKLLIENNLNLTAKSDPCLITKAVKNKTEIAGMIKAHYLDGLAVTKFLFWLKNSSMIDEIKAEEKLLEFRKANQEFLYPSFASISSFGSNGAIIHYKATKKTNKKISGNSLYLIDSGGQYFYGTTDITRTVAIGSPTLAMKNDFTRVLKGHINLARAKFPIGTTGNQLDPLARFNLWQDLKDYDHGTGHGVGSFLSVHEGPVSISKRAQNQSLLPGMILSNEPGYYKEGEYGIRIENLVLVQEKKSQLPGNKKFLHFKTLTLAPIDYQLIDFKMLTYPEKKWLYDYHQEIYDKLSGNLEASEKKWLGNIIDLYAKVGR